MDDIKQITLSDSRHLTASELVLLRKTSNEKEFQYVSGPKCNRRHVTPAEEKVVDCALESLKESLNKKIVSRMCDLIQAEWNADLNVAVTSKLKGKYVQHMGVTKEKEIHLSPEESVFLLQNRSIEITHENMPMSLEKAYAVILKDNLCYEKFQVYLHLAQLGYIVVQHQHKLHAVREQMLNRSKPQTKEKRKAVLPVDEEPDAKRLFTNVLNYESEISNLSDSCITQNSSTLSSDCQILKIDEDAIEVCESNQSIPMISKNKTYELSEKGKSVWKKMKDAEVDNVFETSVISKSELEKQESENSSSIVLKNFDQINPQCVDDKNEHISKSVENIPLNGEEDLNPSNFSPSKNNAAEIFAPENSTSNDSAVLTISDDKLHDEDTLESNLPNGQVQDEDADEKRPTSNNAFKNCVSSCQIGDGSATSKVQDVIEKDEVASCRNSVEMDESSGSESKDVMSCSEDSENYIDVFHSPVNKRVIEEEVTLLEIRKKEKTPLAVIDLLSDEEEDEKMLVDESDEEIKIVEVCPYSSENITSCLKKYFQPVKTEQKLRTQTPSSKVSFFQSIVFPDIYRKDVICLERPQLNLLPHNVRPLKEAYVLDIKRLNYSEPCQNVNNGRLWNSYKDLQEYQRARRRNRNAEFTNWRFPNGESRSFTPNSPQNQGPVADVVNPYLNNSFSEFQPSSPQAANEFSAMARNNFNMGPRNMLPNIPNVTGNLMVDLQRAAYSVATTMLSSMLNQSVPYNMHQYNSFQSSRFRSGHSTFGSDNFVNTQPPGFSYGLPFSNNFMPPNIDYGPGSSRHTDLSSAFNRSDSAHRYSQGWNSHPNFNRNNHFFGRKVSHQGSPFPCTYRNAINKNSWDEVKAIVDKHHDKEELSSQSNDDKKVSMFVNKLLLDHKVHPSLLKFGFRYKVEKAFKKLQVIKMANLLDKKTNVNRFLPSTSRLEISFDVYLPGANFKKTCPDIPKYRFVVTKSTDPLPFISEILLLQRKWKDGAVLQVAVVDNGDISFYSFNSINLPSFFPEL